MVTLRARIAVLPVLVMAGGCWYELHNIRNELHNVSNRINATAHTVRLLAEDPSEQPHD
jgi:hypothetical protein